MEFKIAEIVFYDHVKNGQEPLVCVVYGRILEDTPTWIKIASWDVITSDHALRDPNQETFIILKNTIKKKRILK